MGGRGRLAIVTGVVFMVVGLVAPAQAQASSGQDFSVHVRQCREAMAFSGTHNPGVMHRGFSGWDPMRTC